VRALLDDLAIIVVAADDHLTRDVDTWEDLEEARERAPHAHVTGDPAATRTTEEPS
jgi:hypothetical protein